MNAKQKTDRQGGLSTFRKYGCEHMQKNSRRGGQTTHRRYRMHPVKLSGWAYIDREINEVVAV